MGPNGKIQIYRFWGRLILALFILIIYAGTIYSLLYHVEGLDDKSASLSQVMVGALTVVLSQIGQYMYISVPEETIDGYIPQPAEVDISVVTMTPDVSAQLCAFGAPFKRIDKFTRREIRRRYTIEEEFKALRTNDPEYNEFIEGLVATGKQKKLEILGLSEYSEDNS